MYCETTVCPAKSTPSQGVALANEGRSHPAEDSFGNAFGGNVDAVGREAQRETLLAQRREGERG